VEPVSDVGCVTSLQRARRHGETALEVVTVDPLHRQDRGDGECG